MATQRIKGLILAALLMGCSSSDGMQAGEGDAGQFILHQALACGVQPLETAKPPRVSEGWRYSRDGNGAVIRLPLEDFAAVELFLHRTFGQPQLGPNETTDGGRLGVY